MPLNQTSSGIKQVLGVLGVVGESISSLCYDFRSFLDFQPSWSPQSSQTPFLWLSPKCLSMITKTTYNPKTLTFSLSYLFPFPYAYPLMFILSFISPESCKLYGIHDQLLEQVSNP